MPSLSCLPLLLVLMAGAMQQTSFAREDYEACTTLTPVVEQSFKAIPLKTGPITGGEWWMPLSPDQLETLTHARTQLELIFDPDVASWVMIVDITFHDPLPYGLAYTFYAIKFTWIDSTGAKRESQIDWTHACNDVGFSLYPGQKARFKIALGLPDAEAHLNNVSTKIWGMRI